MSLLEMKKVKKAFGGLIAISNVDIYLEKGEILGMIGPNGAGKTTIFNIISGFYQCDEGKIRFKGEDITNCSPDEICKKGIARTFQVVKPFTNLTVLQNVMIGALNRVKDVSEARKTALEILKYTMLDKRTDQLAGNLSTPERKRLELAKALATKPDLILLDEVAAGLNAKETKEVIRLIHDINKKGITIFVIEHVMKAIMNLSHRIVVLNNGEKISSGTPLEISKDQKVIKAYLGKEYSIA